MFAFPYNVSKVLIGMINDLNFIFENLALTGKMKSDISPKLSIRLGM